MSDQSPSSPLVGQGGEGDDLVLVGTPSFMEERVDLGLMNREEEQEEDEGEAEEDIPLNEKSLVPPKRMEDQDKDKADPEEQQEQNVSRESMKDSKAIKMTRVRNHKI